MKYTICWIIGLFFICSCTQKKDNLVLNEVIIEKFPKEILLKGESFNLEDSLGRPGVIYLFDTLLFLRDYYENNQILVVSPEKRKVINSFIPKGQGPGELIGPTSMMFDKEHNHIYIFDVTLNKLLLIEGDSIYTNGYKPVKTVDLKKRSYEVALYDDTTFYTLAETDDARLLKIHTTNDSINKIGVSPDKTKKISAVINRAYTGTIKISPDKKYIVLANENVDLLEVFTKDCNQQFFIRGPHLFECKYTTSNDGDFVLVGLKDNTVTGYIDINLTNRFIYGLFSGRKIKDPNSSFGRNIYVISYDGTPIANLQLDADAIGIAVDEKKGIIYALVENPEREIFIYHLPKLL